MSMESPDLQTKYQKLASEYSKIKGQNQVLKKAVLEEQGRNGHLKDNLKSQDQSLRKAEQELDSLTFRNQQLIKRLSLLQEDLEALKNKPRKGQAKQEVPVTNSVSDQNVFREELESKIKDNARLHDEVNYLEVFYKNKISELESKLFEASKESRKSTCDVKAKENTLQSEIKRLENEIVVHEVRSQQKETTICLLQKQLNAIKKDASQNNADHSDVLHENEVAVGHQPDSLSEVDCKSLNANSVKQPNGKVIKEFISPINQLCSGFVDFFNSFSKLSKDSNSANSSQLKLIGQMNREMESWNLLCSRFEEMCSNLSDDEEVKVDNMVGMDAFSKALSSCASSLRKLLPVLSEKWLCSQESQLNAPWRSTLGRLVSCWSSLNPYVASLAAFSEARTALTSCAVKKILTLLHERVVKLHFTSNELSSAWELVHSDNKKEEENIQKCLSLIENSLGEICVLLSYVVPASGETNCQSNTPFSVNTLSPGTPQLTPGITGPSYIDISDGGIFSQPEGSCEPLSAHEDVSLAQHLSQATSRLSKLEEEREHWRLEHQLLTHRFHKEVKKRQKYEEELKLLNKSWETIIDAETESAIETKKEEISSSTSSIVEVSLSLCSVESREKEIRDHFTNRCSHLYMQLTSCTSQAALYQDECESLIRRLALTEEYRVKGEQELDRQRKKTAETQETLSTTSRNYEEQISTMSDYLANLNDKIASQAEQIEQLKFELKKKGKK